MGGFFRNSKPGLPDNPSTWDYLEGIKSGSGAVVHSGGFVPITPSGLTLARPPPDDGPTHVAAPPPAAAAPAALPRSDNRQPAKGCRIPSRSARVPILARQSGAPAGFAGTCPAWPCPSSRTCAALTTGRGGPPAVSARVSSRSRCGPRGHAAGTEGAQGREGNASVAAFFG